jgi:hypothetical protein
MNIFKHPGESDLFGLDGLTDEELIAAYNVCLNYKAYLFQIISLTDKSLLAMAPGKDANTVRSNLRLQEKYCNDYIEMWNKVINAGGPKELQN